MADRESVNAEKEERERERREQASESSTPKAERTRTKEAEARWRKRQVPEAPPYDNANRYADAKTEYDTKHPREKSRGCLIMSLLNRLDEGTVLRIKIRQQRAMRRHRARRIGMGDYRR